jgi:hypothetical protein
MVLQLGGKFSLVLLIRGGSTVDVGVGLCERRLHGLPNNITTYRQSPVVTTRTTSFNIVTFCHRVYLCVPYDSHCKKTIISLIN